MSWGVTVPGDDRHVMYVWFDALVNYISTIGWPDNKDEFDKWYEVDPVNVQRKKLLRLGFSIEDIREEEMRIDNQIDLSIKLAKAAPYPDKAELYRELYL